MALLVPTVGEVDGLKAFVAHTAATELIMKLYTNPVTPAEGDTAGSYTEATFNGYSAKTLTGTSWTVTPGDPSVATYAVQPFIVSSTTTQQLIYGYFCVRVTSGILAYAERFTNGPYAMQNAGDTINITPRITLD